jgi:protein Mpv17
MFHIAIGAIAGAAIGAAAAAVAQRARGKRISWKAIAAGAAGGLVAGTVTAATFGAAAAAAGGLAKAGSLALAGGSGGFTEQVTDNVLHERTWHTDAAQTAALGAAAGVATYGAGKGLSALARRAGPAVRGFGTRLAAAAKPLGTRLSALAHRGVAALRHAGSAGARHGRAAWSSARHGLASLPQQARALAGKAAHLPKNLWQGYLRALKSRPLLTKSLTSGALMGSGDLIAQKIEGKESIDWKRTGFMTAYGLVVYGPSTHVWYGWLDKLIPKHTLLPVLAKVGLNAGVWTPYYLSTFTLASGLFNGDRDAASLKRRFGRDFLPTWKADAYVWPAADGIIFTWVPPVLQPAAVSVVSLGWNTYLSLVGNGHSGEDHADEHPHEGEGPPAAESEGLTEALSPLQR